MSSGYIIIWLVTQVDYLFSSILILVSEWKLVLVIMCEYSVVSYSYDEGQSPRFTCIIIRLLANKSVN